MNEKKSRIGGESILPLSVNQRRRRANDSSFKYKLFTFLLLIFGTLFYFCDHGERGHDSDDINDNVVVSFLKICFKFGGSGYRAIENERVLAYEQELELGKSIGGPTLEPSEKHLVKARNGAVACDVPLCSKMGIEILKQNGNAADASVTVALCIGAINSHSSGIGGGGFIVSKKMDEDDAISIDAREMAPGSAYKDMFNNREDLARIGGLSVGIPGELKGLYELYKLHGSKNLTWQQLIQPVIDLTNNGWIVGEVFDKVLKLYTKTYAPGIFNKQDWSFVYNDETGELLSEGDLMKRPSLSHTLSLVAQNGSDAIFYDSEGPIVKSIVEKIQEKGGILTKSDFSKYKIRVEKALITENFTHDNYKIFTSNGASSGAALAAGLNIMNSFNDLNGFDSTAEDFKPIESHRLIETMKWMASVRSNFGDLNIYSKNQSEIEEHWKRYKKFLKPEWSFEINSKINDNYTLPSWKDYEPAYQANNPHGTAHFSIIDKDNNAVAMTTTINLIFGSSIHDPDTGIILNDQMDDFSIPTSPNAFGLQPSIYNYIEPFKRPLSSSSPTIIINSISNKPDLIIGAAGGSKITTCVVQAIIRNYHYKMDLLNVIAAPRLHHQLLPEIVSIEEPLIKYELVDELIKKGHEIELVPHATAMNGIRYNVQEQCWEAVSDYWRKRGEAYGY